MEKGRRRAEVDTSWLKNITELETGAGLLRELGPKRGGGHVRGPKKKSANRRRGLRHHGPHEDLWGHTKREISNENLLNQFFHSTDPPPGLGWELQGESAKGVSSRFGGTDQDHHQDRGEEVQRLTIKSEPLSSLLEVRCWRRLSPVSGLALYASKSSSDLLLSTAGVLRLNDCSSRL